MPKLQMSKLRMPNKIKQPDKTARFACRKTTDVTVTPPSFSLEPGDGCCITCQFMWENKMIKNKKTTEITYYPYMKPLGNL